MTRPVTREQSHRAATVVMRQRFGFLLALPVREADLEHRGRPVWKLDAQRKRDEGVFVGLTDRQGSLVCTLSNEIG